MSNNQTLNGYVNYAVQNKKSKQDVVKALLKASLRDPNLDMKTAMSELDSYEANGMFSQPSTSIDSPKADEISSNLLTSVGQDGKVDPNLYNQKKQEFIAANPQGSDTFDTSFGHLLSDQEKVNLGVKSNEAAPDGTFPQTLASVDKGTADVVKQLTEYKIPLPSGMALKTPYWQKVLELSSQYDPSFDSTQYGSRVKLKNDFVAGKAAQNIRSLNTAVGHLDTLKKAADGLDNKSWRTWNTIGNAINTEVGGDKVKAFDTAATAVEGELASVFKGTGATDQEIKVWRENINSSDSPEQLKKVIDSAIELMGSRLDALSSQYETGMGKQKDFKFLSDKSQKILEGLGTKIGTQDYSTKDNQDTQNPDIQSQQMQTEGNMPAVIDFINRNPNDPQAKALEASIRSGEIDQITGQKKSTDVNNATQQTPIMDTVKGFGKGILQTANNVEKLGEKVFNPIVKGITGSNIDTGNIPQKIDEIATANGTAEKIGKGIEQVAEFFTPVGIEAKSAAAVEKLASISKYLPKAATILSDAIKTGSISGLQEQDIKDAGTVGLVSLALGGIGAGASKVMKPLVETLSEKIPGRILNSIIKPGINDYNFGKDPGAAVVSEGITGKSINDLTDKIVAKKEEIGQAISDSVGKIKDTINLAPAIAEIDKHLASATNQGEQALVSRLQSIKDGLTKTFDNVDGTLVATGEKAMDVTAKEAWKIKQDIGKAAKWTGQAFDNEANIARVDAYKKIASALEEKAAAIGDTGLKKLNSRYANMLTAGNAAERRIAILQRLNKISLGDMGMAGAGAAIAGMPAAAVAYGAKKALSSTLVQSNVAQLLSKMTPAEKSVLEKHLPTLQKIFLGTTAPK